MLRIHILQSFHCSPGDFMFLSTCCLLLSLTHTHTHTHTRIRVYTKTAMKSQFNKKKRRVQTTGE
jgi:hypothetical protein